MSNWSNKNSSVTETELDNNDSGNFREESKDHLVRPADAVLSIENQRAVNGVFVDAPDPVAADGNRRAVNGVFVDARDPILSGYYTAKYTRPGA